MSDSTLHLVRLRLRSDRVARFELTQKLPPHHDDLGYITHGLLAALFGDQAPSPFVVEERGPRELEVLGYGAVGAESLRLHASQFADPVAHETIVIDSLASKPMPPDWPIGTRLGFAVRACPTRRLAKRAPDGNTDRPEVDAWLRACWQKPDSPPPTREDVYVEWLRETLNDKAGVALEHARLESFRVARLVRRTNRASGARKSQTLDRPDAHFSGVLVVRDPSAFRTLLARGVGRHRAFGFGMLLLRPPR